MKRLYLFCTAFLVVWLVTSCFGKSVNEDSFEMEYVPFQESEDGLWGMISPSGKVLFSEEFEEEPTVVAEGRFFVKNVDGYYEMYEASEHPHLIGEKEYASVSMFVNGFAVVAEKDKPISIINRNGETVKVLDKIEGKEVKYVSQNYGDFHLFQTTDTLYGSISRQTGNCIIKPQYCRIAYLGSGRFWVIKEKYRKYVLADEMDKVKVSIITENGDVLFEYPYEKYENFGAYVGDYCPVSILKGGEACWGIIDAKGDYVMNPSSKMREITEIDPYGKKCFIYSNGEKYGLMGMDGKQLIRAKYTALGFVSRNTLGAQVDDEDWKLIDMKDNQLGNEVYTSFIYNFGSRNNYLFTEVGDDEYEIITNKGERVNDVPLIANIGVNTGEVIESDYLDIAKVVEDLQITANGFLGITSSTPTEEVLRIADELLSPRWYTDQSKVSFDREPSMELEVFYPNDLSRETYETQRKLGYANGSYYYYDAPVVSGYEWNNVRPVGFCIDFEASGKMQGKLSSVYRVLLAKFKSIGKIEEQEEDAVIFTLNNGRKALIEKYDDEVYVVWGDNEWMKEKWL